VWTHVAAYATQGHRLRELLPTKERAPNGAVKGCGSWRPAISGWTRSSPHPMTTELCSRHATTLGYPRIARENATRALCALCFFYRCGGHPPGWHGRERDSAALQAATTAAMTGAPSKPWLADACRAYRVVRAAGRPTRSSHRLTYQPPEQRRPPQEFRTQHDPRCRSARRALHRAPSRVAAQVVRRPLRW
jgi:hypothetical protein